MEETMPQAMPQATGTPEVWPVLLAEVLAAVVTEVVAKAQAVVLALGQAPVPTLPVVDVAAGFQRCRRPDRCALSLPFHPSSSCHWTWPSWPS